MSDIIQDGIRGAVIVTDLPDRACFSSWREFVQSLGQYLAVEVPANASGVIFSPSEPGEDERNVIWVQRAANGEVRGIFLFTNGAWQANFGFIEREYKWLAGDSANPPKGTAVILPGDGVFSPQQVSHIINQYLPNGAGGYSIFAVRQAG